MLELIGQSVPPPDAAPASAGISLVALAAAFSGGIVLWLAGRRVLRPGFVFIGAFLGAVVGVLAGSALDLDFDATWLGAFGLLTGGILGWLLFRLAIALSMALLLGIALTVITGSAMAFQSPSPDVPAAQTTPSTTDDESSLSADEVAETIRELRERIPEVTLAAPESTEAQSAVERAQEVARDVELLHRSAEFASDLADELDPIWQRIPSRVRWLMLGASILGVALGLFGGLAAPTRAAGLVTAFIGPAIWLPSGALFALRIEEGASRVLPSSPMVWLAMWAGAAVIGLIVQWTPSRPSADKS